MINCIITGVGGQGTVLASKLIAMAAMEKGLNIRTTETIGMAQRGGSVVSHVRMGQVIHSPLVPRGKADIIIGFEPAEAVRLAPYFSDKTVAVVCDSPIQPITSSISGAGYDAESMLDFLKAAVSGSVIINGRRLLAECENPKGMNVALLGAALRCGVLPFDEKDMENVIRKNTPERFLKMNLAALHAGGRIYDEC